MNQLRIGGTYRHKKTGGKYEAEGRMKLQISPETLAKIAQITYTSAERVCLALEQMTFVSYSSKADEDAIFGRPETEFLDGRFEDVTPKPGWVLRRRGIARNLDDPLVSYHNGNKEWVTDVRDAKLYSEESFALRDRSDLFSKKMRESIETVRIEQEPK